MPIRILAEDAVLAPAEEWRLRHVSARLPRYFHDIVSVEWDLTTDGRDQVAACKVHSKSGYYRAEVASDRLGKSIDEAFDKIVRQRRRRKVMRLSARRAAK